MNASGRLIMIGAGTALLKAAEKAVVASRMQVVLYADARQFVGEDHADGIGCVVLDLDELGDTGPAVLDDLTACAVRWPLIVCASDAPVPTVVQAMKRGAFDFVTDYADTEQLSSSVERAIREAALRRQARRRLRRIQGRLGALTRREAAVLEAAMGSVVDPAPFLRPRDRASGNGRGRAVNRRDSPRRHGASRAPRVQAPDRAEELSQLTPRLRQTLEHLLEGESEKQVARQMGLSRHTVHDYVKALHKHFRVRSRGELMARFLAPEQDDEQKTSDRIAC